MNHALSVFLRAHQRASISAPRTCVACSRRPEPQTDFHSCCPGPCCSTCEATGYRAASALVSSHPSPLLALGTAYRTSISGWPRVPLSPVVASRAARFVATEVLLTSCRRTLCGGSRALYSLEPLSIEHALAWPTHTSLFDWVRGHDLCLHRPSSEQSYCENCSD